MRPTPLGELDGARAFVGLAWADELALDPALIAAWADAFGADDDATLVIYAPGGDEGAVVDALAPALAAAGIGDDDERDLALVIGAATPEREVGLARGACVAVSRRGLNGPFALLTALDGPDALRAAAAARLTHDGLGRPLSIAIKLCVARSDDAAKSTHLPLACAIADALARHGHAAVVQPAEDWDGVEARDCNVALHLRGPWPYVPAPGETAVLWPLATPRGRDRARGRAGTRPCSTAARTSAWEWPRCCRRDAARWHGACAGGLTREITRAVCPAARPALAARRGEIGARGPPLRRPPRRRMVHPRAGGYGPRPCVGRDWPAGHLPALRDEVAQEFTLEVRRHGGPLVAAVLDLPEDGRRTDERPVELVLGDVREPQVLDEREALRARERARVGEYRGVGDHAAGPRVLDAVARRGQPALPVAVRASSWNAY